MCGGEEAFYNVVIKDLSLFVAPVKMRKIFYSLHLEHVKALGVKFLQV